MGFDIGPTETPIIPILIGPMNLTFQVWRDVFDAGRVHESRRSTSRSGGQAAGCVQATWRHIRTSTSTSCSSSSRKGRQEVRSSVSDRGGRIGRPVKPADDRKRFRDFIELPYRIYDGDPNWVAPLIRDVKGVQQEETSVPYPLRGAAVRRLPGRPSPSDGSPRSTIGTTWPTTKSPWASSGTSSA